MRNILFDCMYYQGGAAFHGGGEYGNTVLAELLKQPEQINCGIFFTKGKKINLQILKKCMESGWRIHEICDVRNLSAIVKEYHYKTIYSALPYIGKHWNQINLAADIRFIGTFHGLRNIELADCEISEKSFYEQEQAEFPGYIFGAKDMQKSNTHKESYRDVLFAFQNKKIIAVSEHTKHSIFYHYPQLRNEDIEVLYSPPKLVKLMKSDSDEIILKREGIKARNFGLIVSAGIWYKNGKRAILAYDRVFENNYDFIPNDFKVVVLGVSDGKNILNGVIHKERFLLKDYIPAEMLEALYRNAHLFVFPSLNEGFGYPPLEAMTYGTLCACSVNTSIAEICGDMVLYFNPLLVDEIAIRILESFSEHIRNEKEKKIKERLPIVQHRQKEDLQKLVKIITGEM